MRTNRNVSPLLIAIIYIITPRYGKPYREDYPLNGLSLYRLSNPRGLWVMTNARTVFSLGCLIRG
jgi:hypothetical protein